MQLVRILYFVFSIVIILDTHLWFWSPFLKKALAHVTSTTTADTSLFPFSPFCLRVRLWVWVGFFWGFFVGYFDNLLKDGKESEFFMFSC